MNIIPVSTGDLPAQFTMTGQALPGSSKPLTWWDETKARWYVGRYNYYMRSDRNIGCLSSRPGMVRLTPIEEAAFCRAVLASMLRENARDVWSFDQHLAHHVPSGTAFWIANDHDFFRVYRPYEIPLRSETQGRLFRTLIDLRDGWRRARHRTFSPEARDLIATFVS